MPVPEGRNEGGREEGLSTILQHFTHNETQWPTTARRCHFALRDVSCRQNWHFSTPSHPCMGSPRVAVLLASPVRTLVHYVVKHSRPPDLKSSSKVNLTFACITGPATGPNSECCFIDLLLTDNCYFFQLHQLQIICALASYLLTTIPETL